MRDHKHELDVDFEVIEDPEDLVFPRLPNVISHRGHRVKIIATIRDVPYPERTTELTLTARINVLKHATLNEKGHVSLPFQIWGVAEDMVVEFPSDRFPQLPFKLETYVSMRPDDDHLGQGPDYEAVVDVTTSSNDFTPAGRDGGDDGAHPDHEDESADTRLTEGSFIIRFTSK